MKRCLNCQQAKAAAEYYKQAGGTLQSRCKRCHNEACAVRRQTKLDYRKRQYLAKQSWNQRNPQRVKTHRLRCLGRLIWDPRQEGVPSLCRELEAALWSLREAISSHGRRE